MKSLSIGTSIRYGSSLEFKDSVEKEVSGKKSLFFITASSSRRLDLNDWLNNLENEKDVVIYKDIPSNPTYKDIYNTLKSLRDIRPELIVAIGGGSAIDLAKAYSGLIYLLDKDTFNPNDILESLRDKEYLSYENDIAIYGVPTTAGTGSEVTSWATVWDLDSDAKYSIDAKWLLPKLAYITPEFTRTMPARLTLSTGLDALCQAVEAYWARATNPIVKILSISAIELIVEYLPKALKDLDNIYYREKMALGSLYSGLAFTNTRTTACHSISYPLTMKFDIEHGLACCLTLAEVLRINEKATEGLDELYRALGVDSPEALQRFIDELSSGIVDMRLSSFGVEEKDLEMIASLSFTQGRMDNNPVDITEEDVVEILKKTLF